ncbi:MAG: hypothetical protein MZV64_43125 [Ignavibacteriales bacterium]|nr:hypothetical protein [Ignavibacteriales bacterium]
MSAKCWTALRDVRLEVTGTPASCRCGPESRPTAHRACGSRGSAGRRWPGRGRSARGIPARGGRARRTPAGPCG